MASPPPNPPASPEGAAPQRTIRIPAIARVEGESALTIRLRDGQVEDVRLRIFEAPRFFEALLRGRDLHEVPDITSRICGICPIAYQMSSCHALEQLLGVELPDSLRALRRLIYCGEWIESHTLHIYFLQGPDFLGYESAIAMAQARPEYAELIRNGLQLKKAGNSILATLGGRAVHPISVRVGGFYRVPEARELAPLLEELKRAADLARATVAWAARLDIPAVEHDYEFIALRHESEYPMNEGRLVSNRGLDIAMHEFPDHFGEYQVPYSNALQCRRQGGGAYFVGPLARWNLNLDRATDAVRQLAGDTGISWPSRNPYAGIVARCLEVCYAVDEAVRIIEAYEPPERPFVPHEPRAGQGAWITEAPRGALYHRYETDAQGRITRATIVPPTSQNQRQIEEDLIRFAPSVLHLGDDEAAWECERVVRNYDPCISCSSHFLKLKVESV
jgi:coenzyme F420-reducing hydrogenase alpha subunit